MSVKKGSVFAGVFGILQFGFRLLVWVGFLAILPAIILGVLPLFLWKASLRVWVRIRFGDKFEGLLSFFDTVFALDEFYVRPYASTAKYLVLDGRLDLAGLKTRFCDRVLFKRRGSGEDPKARWQFQRLHQIPKSVGWFLFWKEISVNVDLHIKEVVLGGDKGFLEEAELCRYLGELMTQPFPGGSALWEVILVNDFERHKSVVILRVHHVIADGYTFNSILDELTFSNSNYIVKSRTCDFRHKLNFIWTAPSWSLGFFLEELLCLNSWVSPKPPSGNTTGVLAVTTLPLDIMRQIRRTTNTHFAAIGLSLLGGALRRLFLQCHGKDGKKLPKYVKIMHLLPKPNHPFDRMCNHWSAGSFKIPVKTESALERLRETEEYFRDFTENHYNQLLEMQSYFAGLMPLPVYKMVLTNNYATNMAFTSLPGYDGPASLCDLPITDVYKICGLQYRQTALGAAAYSHNGRLTFTIYANTVLVPSQEWVERLAKEYIHEELQELVNQLQMERLPV